MWQCGNVATMMMSACALSSTPSNLSPLTSAPLTSTPPATAIIPTTQNRLTPYLGTALKLALISVIRGVDDVSHKTPTRGTLP